MYLLLCVQCWTPDDGQRNCPKHLEFYYKNKFEKLVHLVGFIIRIYHDARSSECQIPINPSNANFNPICHLLALLGAHHILHVSGEGVNNDTCVPLSYFHYLKPIVNHMQRHF